MRAQEAGRAAARSGRPPTACPHKGRSDREVLLRAAWVRGYAKSRELLHPSM
ncbi:Rmf/CrpP fold protein [Streptomyces sp. BK239]|uniref:Rmf/CrpP fold protein n=1 Tax=Streptomyces sp. BK239 TaxID=2512155 RepID=UPI003241E9A8